MSENDTNTATLKKLVGDIENARALTADWSAQHRTTLDTILEAVDALHKEAFARLIKAVCAEAPGKLLLKASLADSVVYTVLRHHGLVRASLQERIEAALESVRPALAEHGGDVHLVSIDSPSTITIKMTGACEGCPASEITLQEGIERAIKEHCPEIVDIKKARGSILPVRVEQLSSPFARTSPQESVSASPDAHREHSHD